MEYVITPAVIVVGIGGFLGAVFGTSPNGRLLVGCVLCHFRWTQYIGSRINLSIFSGHHPIALAILVCFSAIPHFDWTHALDIKPQAGQSQCFRSGRLALQPAFMIWFFSREQLPLAAEDHDQRRDMPGILLGNLTLVITA